MTLCCSEVMEVNIDFKEINDWESFHKQLSKVMGFPNFYGNNMNAWIDCMSYINDPDSGMSEIVVASGEELDIVVRGTEEASKKCSEVLVGFIECVAAVYRRFIESETKTRLRLITT